MREVQREATRQQIVSAALVAISEAGFDGATTRAIALRAGVSQGLLTYHFKSKDALWRAAADHLFSMIRNAVDAAIAATDPSDPREQRREILRRMVRLGAEHPEILRFMIDSGNRDDGRARWLVETHTRPHFEKFSKIMGDFPKEDLPHAFYMIAGGASAMFCVPDECVLATGTDPRTDAAITRHADFLARLMVPD